MGLETQLGAAGVGGRFFTETPWVLKMMGFENRSYGTFFFSFSFLFSFSERVKVYSHTANINLTTTTTKQV